jgi:L-serine dehydratase
MQSLKYLYRYGMGPSSSHTIGPNNAAMQFKAKNIEAKSYRVKLYGSLSLTGKGHLTDKAIISAFAPVYCEIIWCDKLCKAFAYVKLPEHLVYLQRRES